MSDGPEISGDPRRFPTTHWSMLDAVRGPMTAEHREVLNCLILRYWQPVYAYVFRRGFQNDAADLTQDFFVNTLRRELFGRADRDRGRFRTFLLSCLKNFLVDAHRHEKHEIPPEGIVSIQQLATDADRGVAPSDDETPVAVFDRAWVLGLLQDTWARLQDEFDASGQQVHCELFRRRVYDPIISDVDSPSMDELAKEFHLARKEACNRLVTARRAFQRLLREEVRVYANSEEEIAAEVRELFRFAAGS